MPEQRLQQAAGLRGRLGVVIGLLLGVGVLSFLWQVVSQAGTVPFEPQVLAFFKDNQLLVVVNPQSTKASVSVELVGAAGESAVNDKQVEGSYRFKADQADAAKLSLRVSSGGRTVERPLSRVLLIKGHETALATGQEFYAGSRAALSCTVQGVRSLTETAPLPGSEVVIRLRDKAGKTRQLYQGTTDRSGQARAEFDIPALSAGPYTLEVETRSPFGSEKLEHAITLKSDAKVLLVTDKPIYQPGQLMHLRALVLHPFDMRPVAGQDLLFEVEDPKGNKVFKKVFKTSEYGIAAVDFQLADEVNMGDYHLRAVLGETHAEKTVGVKRYVLPKFKVEVKADKTFYLPKETIKAELRSDYFFGKPVADAQIEVTASTFDVAFRKFHTWKGTTDALGHAKFEIRLPDYFVGQPLQQGNALVKLDVTVHDSADHSETVVKSYTVSEQPIRVSLIPEGGKLVPAMENRIFAAAVYPDGSPAASCEVRLWHETKQKGGEPIAVVTTNAAGLAEFKITPKAEQFRQGNWVQYDVELLGGRQQNGALQLLFDLRAETKDAKGNTATVAVALTCHPLGENVLLRLDKAIYQVGERMHIDVRSSAGLPTVYVDIVRGGQIMLSRWLTVKEGQASQPLDLPQSVFGSLEVHAYQMLAHGEIIRDSRVVYVQPRNDLKVEVTADRGEYEPGAQGRIRFQVTDQAGKPTAAALGVIVVDEAVYALQDLQPGLEKVYFSLQEELLKPQAQLHMGERLDNIVRQPVIPAPRQQVAEVLLTAVKLPPPQRWNVNPAVERQQRVESQLQYLGHAIFNYASNLGPALARDKETGRWDFKPTLLDDMIKANYLQGAQLKGLFGEQKLDLHDLARLEKDFTPDHLGRAVTGQRIFSVMWTVVNYANQNRAKYFKAGAWALPTSVLADAVAAQRLDSRYLQDAWGQPLRMVHRDKKAEAGQLQPLFENYDIISLGPDGKLGSQDDLSLREIVKPGHDHRFNGWWWSRQAQVWSKRGMLRMQGRGGAMFFGMKRQAGAFAMPEAAAAGLAGGGRLLDNLKADRGADGVTNLPRSATAAPALRVREYFPETMLWQPALITDEHGVADLAVNFADSITTWRLSAFANSTGGALGGATTALKVFQNFFVDIDMPINLTQEDEIAFPVAVYNYLKTPQTVKLVLQEEPWFELLDDFGLTRSLDLKPNEVTSVKYRIRASKIGAHPLTVKAFGSHKSDAVKRIVEVVPNGQKFEKVVTDRLTGRIQQAIDFPASALPDASKLLVRVYPGVMAQVVEGLDGMLRMPGGCFEQTSSSAYPNIMIVDYIKKNRLTSPQMLMQAEQYLNIGYQRLLTFERPGGGFDWWGREEPLVWLSAYGLQEFSDMARVYPIDRGIIGRTQAFLLKKRDKDGTWSNIGATHGETIASMGDPKLLLTSYVVWSLLESGYDREQLKQSIAYIRTNLGAAGDNAYILALAANALAAYDAKDASTLEAIQKLEKLRHEIPEWRGAANFPARGTSLTYARGDGATIETTALAALAMIKTGQFTNSVNQALTYLVKAKSGGGTWGSTQGTILALKALVAGMGGQAPKEAVHFAIKVNGKDTARGKVDADNADLMQTFELKGFNKSGANRIEIETTGATNLMYQIVGRYYEPWQQKSAPSKPVLEIDVAYDRTKLATSDLLHAKATLKYHGAVPTYMVMLDLGIAPGFTVEAGDFEKMVAKGAVKKFSFTARQVILYLGDVKPGDVLSFEYALRPRFPLRARTAPSVAYEYNTPGNRAEAQPVELVVEERK
jgi:hypothetical protein